MDKFEIFEWILRIPIVLLSLTVHEVAHGYAAYKLGDPTAKNLGRLSLNPLKHLDPIGALCMLVFRFGWAKPVPISTRYFKKPKRDMAISALAGPLSNLLMGFVTFIISEYILRFGNFGTYYLGDTFTSRMWYIAYIFFSTFFVMNVSLAVFNLIPIPPLDGSRILFVLLPDKYYFGFMKYEQYISLALMACLFLGLLDGILSGAVGGIIGLFDFFCRFLPFL